MKVKIIYEFKDGPWGGANQFLTALKKQFIEMGVYTEEDDQADVFLINSFNAFLDFKNVYKLRKKYKNALFVHRVDGPIFLIRGKDKYIDKIIFYINSYIADATIYQTEWSKQRCIEQGMLDDKPNTVICNGSNKEIFNTEGKRIVPLERIKIIATSWSDNWNKGFEYYKYLDENLDMNKYQFTFVGNSPIEFKNSVHLPPVKSTELAELLKESDIYITASRKDPCSNSLIEALNCGLPTIAYHDGGHPEIIGKGGETFESKAEMMSAIDKVAVNLSTYQKNIISYDIRDIAKEYCTFCEKMLIRKEKKTKAYKYDLAYIKVSLIKGCEKIKKHLCK